MKKIIGLTIATMMVMVLVAGGTWAYFTDTQQGTVTLAAGTLNLKINSAESTQVLVNATVKKPGDSDVADTTYKTLANDGTLAAKLSGKVTVAGTNLTDMTGKVTGGNATNSTADDLIQQAKLLIWIDVDGGGTWTDGDVHLKSTGAVTRAAGSPATLTIDTDGETFSTLNNVFWNFFKTDVAAAASYRAYTWWKIPTTTGNAAQGDQNVATVEFYLSQDNDSNNPYS